MSLAMSNARWISLSQGVRVLAQLLGIALLARLLPPEAYGLMAMAGVVTNLGYLLRDMGTGAAIIQSPTISERLTGTVHWTNVGLGLSLGLFIAALASPLAQVFHEPGLAPVLVLLAFIFPFSALGVVRQALLERESRFARVALIEIGATLIGLAAAVVLALHDYGVLALAAQALLTAALSSIGLALASNFRPQLRWSRYDFRTVAGFSGKLTLFNVVLYLSRNADSAIIGRLLGAPALGIYSLAYRVMLFPVQNLTYVASRALFPVLSRSSREEGGALYLKSVGFIAFITAPLMAGLFVLREPFVAVVFGTRWEPAVVVLAWLAPVGFIQSMVSTTGTVFMAAGRSGQLLNLGVLSMLLQIAAFAIGAHWGIEGVATCYLIANLINAIPALSCCASLQEIPLQGLLRAIALPLGAALAMALVVLVVQVGLQRHGVSALLQLLCSIATGVVAYAGAALLMQPQVRQLQLFLGFR